MSWVIQQFGWAFNSLIQGEVLCKQYKYNPTKDDHQRNSMRVGNQSAILYNLFFWVQLNLFQCIDEDGGPEREEGEQYETEEDEENASPPPDTSELEESAFYQLDDEQQQYYQDHEGAQNQ